MVENLERVRMHPVFTAEPERLIHRGQPDKLCGDRCKVSKAAQETSIRSPFQREIMTFYFNLQSTLRWCTLVLFPFDSLYKHS